jgi:LPS sulfotransferase NodH
VILGKPAKNRTLTPEELYQKRIGRVLNNIERLLDSSFTSNPFRSPRRKFAIASSARTGSNLLCEGLLSHGGVAQELFHFNRLREVSDRFGLTTLQAYCERVLENFTVGGVFGVKGGFEILGPLVLSGEIPGALSDWRFVYLKRMDVVKQAVSHFRAELTGSWRSAQMSRELVDDDYDGQRIAVLAKGHLDANLRWEETFEFLGVEPLKVTYEELSADTAGVVAKVAAFLGLLGPPVTEERFLFPPLQVQATTLNSNWEARFAEEGWRLGQTERPVPAQGAS